MTMPNNVTNVVIFHGDEQRIREILEAIQMEDIGPGSKIGRASCRERV